MVLPYLYRISSATLSITFCPVGLHDISTMVYLTIAIRWCCTPLEHINIIKANITKWYISRWTYADTRHLTVICVQTESKRASTYIGKLLGLMQNLWVEQTHSVMTCGDLDTLLGNKNSLAVVSNIYSVTYTDSRPGLSFYRHLTNTVALVKGYEWTLRKGSTVADNGTNMKLYCQHVSLQPIIIAGNMTVLCIPLG